MRAKVLTDLEIQIIRRLAKGTDNATIGKELYMSKHTVKAHVSLIIKKLNAANRTNVVYLAVRKNIIE